MREQTATRHLWVPLRTPEDHGPRAYAAQMLEMLVGYRLVDDAHLTDDGGFVVTDGGRRRSLTPDQVLDEYGELLAEMADQVMEHSDLTTTEVSVTVGAPGGPVPYIEDPSDRVVEYRRLWPRATR